MKNNCLIEKIPRKCPKVSFKKLDTLMTSVSKFDTTVANEKNSSCLVVGGKVNNLLLQDFIIVQ